MKKYPTISELVGWAGADVNMSQSLLSRTVKAISMDSRKITPGYVFLALSTSKNDGHDFRDCGTGSQSRGRN